VVAAGNTFAGFATKEVNPAGTDVHDTCVKERREQFEKRFTLLPGQTATGETLAVTDAVGLTVMLKLSTGPWQPLTVAVTLIVVVIANVLMLTAVKEGILPLPLKPKPISTVLVHVNDEDGIELPNITPGAVSPLQ